MEISLLRLIIDERKSNKGFSRIRKELIESKRFNEEEVKKAIGVIHDHEAEITKFEISKKKNLSLFIGCTVIFLGSSIYTLLTYFNPELSYYVFLYGPIFAGLVFGFMALDKYRSAKYRIDLLNNKF